MSIQRKGERQKAALKAKPEVHNLKDAYIITKENGDKMIEVLGELPGKYWEGIIGPMMALFQNTFRGNVQVTIDPTKPAPLPETEAETPTRKLDPVLKQTPKEDKDA